MDGKKIANLWDQSCCLMEQMLHFIKYCRWLDVNVLRHNVRQLDVVKSKLELTALNFVDVKIVKTKNDMVDYKEEDIVDVWSSIHLYFAEIQCLEKS